MNTVTRGLVSAGKYILVLLSIMGVVLFSFTVALEIYGTWRDGRDGTFGFGWSGQGSCSIAVLRIDGEITTFPYIAEDSSGYSLVTTSMVDTLALLKQAEEDPTISGVLVLIDSPGGSPAASKMIADALRSSPLPTVAYVLDYAASGGYYVATGADTIIASPFADVGSIGITMSYVDNSRQNADMGLEFVSLASGKFKDAGTPEKPLTPEERQLFERNLKIFHDTFVSDVARNRSLSALSVAELADGSTLPSSLAQEAGLIDSVGEFEAVTTWLSGVTGLPSNDVRFCM